MPGALLLPVILSFVILLVPARWANVRNGWGYDGVFWVTIIVTLQAILVTGLPAIRVMANPGTVVTLTPGIPAGAVTFTIDRLTALFILVIHFTVLTGLLYSHGYLRRYRAEMLPSRFALHYFSFCWLHLSMLAVVMLREGLAFLVAWELMAVSSFMLILFEAGNRQTLKTAVNYLVQMHIGMVLLVAGFLVAEAATGKFGFEGMTDYFATRAGFPLFLIFFAGFAFKAGFLPFHTWLPEAHPAAPSHVSGVMSGVMIKMGIYGIVRLVLACRSDLLTVGVFLASISLLTMLYGILMSSLQTDLKRILAFSSIENIGIIGLGLGTGAIGLGTGHPLLALAGMGGALLHVVNHSLFKSLLFYSAGSVYQVTHTRDADLLGGLIHHMPRTAGFFLAGSMALCALPPLNGFISELVIYYGLFAGLKGATLPLTVFFVLSVAVLAVTGGLALHSFSRTFGLTFLGSPRSGLPVDPAAVTRGMILPKVLATMAIVTIGLAPAWVMKPVFSVVSELAGPGAGMAAGMMAGDVWDPLFRVCAGISAAGIVLLLLVAGLLYLRSRVVRPGRVAYGPTWGCGYTAPATRQQYTATSWAGNVAELAGPVTETQKTFTPIDGEDIFPARRSFTLVTNDLFRTITGRVTGAAMLALKKMARLQTGYLQHYLLYAFIFMLIIFALLYFNLI